MTTNTKPTPMTDHTTSPAEQAALDRLGEHAHLVRPLIRTAIEAAEPHHTIAALEKTGELLEQFAARQRSGGNLLAPGIEEAAEVVWDQVRTLRTRLDARTDTTKEN